MATAGDASPVVRVVAQSSVAAARAGEQPARQTLPPWRANPASRQDASVMRDWGAEQRVAARPSVGRAPSDRGELLDFADEDTASRLDRKFEQIRRRQDLVRDASA